MPRSEGTVIKALDPHASQFLFFWEYVGAVEGLTCDLSVELVSTAKKEEPAKEDLLSVL